MLLLILIGNFGGSRSTWLSSHTHHWMSLILWWSSMLLRTSHTIHLLLLLLNHHLLWVDCHISHLIIHHVHVLAHRLLLHHLLTWRHSHHLRRKTGLTPLVHLLLLLLHLKSWITVLLWRVTLHSWRHLPLIHHHLLHLLLVGVLSSVITERLIETIWVEFVILEI